MAVALDTLAYARRLREAGFSDEQAEGQADALAAAMTDTLATRQDLREIETRMDSRFLATQRDIQDLETRIGARFAQVDVRFAQLESQMDARFAQVDARFAQLESQMDARFAQVDARFTQVQLMIVELEKRMDIKLDARLAALEHRMTLRLGGICVASVGMMSAILRLS